MQEVFKAIGRLSRSSMTVLITGESGTGKELVARALHDNSPRATKPFVALNTSAIAAELLESELFGHEKGAFTGATERRIGRFEQANGGTLFLDEIGDMSLPLQTRLLRVLAESEFFRVGGQTPIRVDVRVIAATHQDLGQAVATGRFREDLYHRLNVMRIEVPPLRQRREDIKELSRFYLEQAANELGVALEDVERRSSRGPAEVRLARQRPRARERQPAAHGDRGRTRDRRAGPAARARRLDDESRRPTGPRACRTGPRPSWRWRAPPPLLADALPAFERTLIITALRRARGKRLEAAKLLGWGRNTLTRKIKELGLEGRV